MATTAEFEAFHEQHRPAINDHLSDFFTDVEEEHAAERKTAAIDRFAEFVLRGGKRLRPLSVLLGYGAVTGDDPDEPLYRLSLPVEIYHNGTLIQDDLMDQDGTRRGGPAYHKLRADQYRDLLPAPSIASGMVKRVKGFLSPGLESAGRREMAASGQAITGGNQLDNFADWPVYRADIDDDRRTDILEILNDTGIAVNFGQDFDLELEQLTLQDVAREEGVLDPSLNERLRTGVYEAAEQAQDYVDPGRIRDGLSWIAERTDTSNHLYDRIIGENGSLVDAYMTMIDEKTVDLYVASIDIGAVIGGATERQREYLRDAMRDIGRAFQIQDDYLEIEESVEETGKEPTDVINGKLTLASISTYESLNAVVDVLDGAADRFDTAQLASDHRDRLTEAMGGSSYDAAVDSVDSFLDEGEAAVHAMLDTGIDITEYGEDAVMDYLDPELLRRSRDEVVSDRDTFLNNYGNLSTLRPETSFRKVTEIIAEYSYGKEMAEDLLESAKETLDEAQTDVGLDPAYTERLKGLADYMLERSH